MKKRLKEESIIFISIFKWLILATFIGVLVGLSTTLFLKALNWSVAATESYPFYFLAMPAAFFLSTLMIKKLAPEAEGYGATLIDAVHKRSGKIRPAVIPVKFVATILTVASGGSAGKEGPCAQIGAGLASFFADLFKFSESDRKKLVICGISGGFAAVFGTPIAGAIFGVEVLFVGGILYEVLLPSFVAGIISYQVSSGLGITYFHYPVKFVPVFSESFFIMVVFAGIFFGFTSFLFVEILRLGHKYSKKLTQRKNLSDLHKSLIGGAVLVAMAFLFSGRFLGLGLGSIASTLEGGDVPFYSFFMKAIFTSITLNFGGSGGIQTPMFFIGATSGNLFAKVFGLDPAIFAAIGFASLLAGAANTPIAASILAVELFGVEVAPYAAVASVICFVMTGHRSVYPTQVLAMKKSSSIEVPLGKELEAVKPVYRYREKSFISLMKAFLAALKDMRKGP